MENLTHQVSINLSSVTDVRSSAFIWTIDLNTRLPRHQNSFFPQASQLTRTSKSESVNQTPFNIWKHREENERKLKVRIRFFLLEFESHVVTFYSTSRWPLWITRIYPDVGKVCNYDNDKHPQIRQWHHQIIIWHHHRFTLLLRHIWRKKV